MNKFLHFLIVLLFICGTRARSADLLMINADFNLINTEIYAVLNLQIPVKGTVTDEKGISLPGVSVRMMRTGITTSTDANGNFNIEAAIAEDSVQFSYVGYQTQVIKVAGQAIINVKMLPSDNTLSEVAVVGFGQQKKISVTGALSTISTKEILRSSTPSLSNAIAGKLPGIITRQSSGEPGSDAAQVYIRGLSTFVNNSPLILVDGVERNMNQLNAQEIENFTILKDASATALYGVRGANGVILINTKRGALGKPQITVRSEFAGLTALRLPEYINGFEYASLMNEARIRNGQDARWSDAELQKYADGSDPYLYPNSNWTNAVLKRNTWQTINNLSVTGGSEVIKYYTNVGYTLQDGIYKQDPENKFSYNATIKRYNFRSNVDIKLAKNLDIQLNLGGIIRTGVYPGFATGDIFQSLAVISPIAYPVRNPDGSPGGASTYVGWNPWGRVTQSGYRTEDESTLQGTFGAKWDISSFTTKGLSLRALFAYDRNSQTSVARRKDFEVKTYLGKDPNTGEDLYSDPFRQEQPLGFDLGNGGNRALYLETQINYERTFGDHALTSMLLFNRRESVNYGTPFNPVNSSGNIPGRYQGLAGRTTYGYKNRYLAEFNFGYNGSEQFPKGKRYGFFPSISAGWVVSNEEFWKVPVISSLKFRGSYGAVGNDRIGGSRFLYLSRINTNGQSYYFGQDQNLIVGVEEDQTGNPNVTWETALKTNLGMDITMFRDVLSLQLNLFKERRKDILLQRQTVPSTTGFFPWSIPYGNLGEVKNKGIDALLEVKNTTPGGFFYSFRGNFTYAKNIIVENDEAPKLYPYQSGKGIPVGQPLAFVSEGFFQSQDEIDASPRQTFSTPRVGDVKYKDINGDGIIDSFDQIPVGYARLPEISFGFGATFSYKNFDISAYFTGAANTTIILSGYSIWPFYDGMGVNNVLRDYYDNRWTPSTPNARYPGIDVGNNPNNFLNSTLWMRNGNYLRLRNAEIGYTFPKRLVQKVGIGNLRVFVNGMNLVTWDHVKIIDPESDNGTGGYPLQRSFNGGLQIDFK